MKGVGLHSDDNFLRIPLFVPCIMKFLYWLMGIQKVLYLLWALEIVWLIAFQWFFPYSCGDFFSMYAQISSVQSLSHGQLFTIPWTAARQASLSITNSQSLLKHMSIELVMPPNHPILCHPLCSHLQAFPASGSFQVSQLFASRGQSIGVSASTSLLPMNIQDWSPLGWAGLISLLSKGLSRVFSNTTVQKLQFFGAQLSL